MVTIRSFAFVVTAPLLMALVGCGYHLRGQGGDTLNFSTVAVTGGSDDPLMVERVKDAFDRNDIRVVENDGERRLDISGSRQQRSVSAVDSAGNVAVYALDYTMTFSFYGPDGQARLSGVSVSAHRQYEFNQREVLGKDAEQERLYTEMRSDLVRDMMRRVGRAERKAQ